TPWLEGATDTELPSGTKVQQVTTDGSTAIVNLGGDVAQASPKQLQLFAAQLVWTLTGSLNISAVMLERAGQPWAPSSAPCPGGPAPGSQQTQAAYECFDPYPSSPTSFYYVDRGQSWARCGAQESGKQGFIGPVVPVVGRTGSFSSQRCDDTAGSVREAATAPPPSQPPSLPAISMAAVSPDGKYLALVTAAKGEVYAGSLSGRAASFLKTPRLTGGGVTALSWDRNDDLWVAQSGNILMLPPTGKGQVQVWFDGNVTDLSVAPDGVRIALIAQIFGASSPGLYLAAIGAGGQSSVPVGSAATRPAIRTYASLGPGISDPSSFTWYDADDLLVVDHAHTLWEAPVDGQPAQPELVSPPDVTSITASGPANYLVAGLSGNSLDVSPSLEGPWNPLSEPGSRPVYPG
ncbi:MAG: GerMN domain-containing protein, partial [Solirubrobacterales bacterium]|nr:GerMN domain-containing protein [Solirubrobacterales bacterium]